MQRRTKLGLAGLALAGSMYLAPALESRGYGQESPVENFARRVNDSRDNLMQKYDKNNDHVLDDSELHGLTEKYVQTVDELYESKRSLERNSDALVRNTWVVGGSILGGVILLSLLSNVLPG